MDEDRDCGMGIVAEYAGRKGKPQWHPPGKSDWIHLLFGESKSAIQPDEVIPMEEVKADSTSGQSMDKLTIRTSRSRFSGVASIGSLSSTKSDDMHPLHLHRHNFEMTKINGKKLPARHSQCHFRLERVYVPSAIIMLLAAYGIHWVSGGQGAAGFMV
jgi:hypothetical protein